MNWNQVDNIEFLDHFHFAFMKRFGHYFKDYSVTDIKKICAEQFQKRKLISLIEKEKELEQKKDATQNMTTGTDIEEDSQMVCITEESCIRLAKTQAHRSVRKNKIFPL
jgi:hypothetical protein